MATANPSLVALTPEAESALQNHQITLTRYPFRIGRESRLVLVDGEMKFLERRKTGIDPNNDLYIPDEGELLNVSREHLQIERTEDGQYFIYDRGSACGTIVDGNTVGGRDSTGSLPIRNGSILIVGTPNSPFRFRFEVPE